MSDDWRHPHAKILEDLLAIGQFNRTAFAKRHDISVNSLSRFVDGEQKKSPTTDIKLMGIASELYSKTQQDLARLEEILKTLSIRASAAD